MRFTLYRLTALVIDAAQLILIVRAVVSFLPVNRDNRLVILLYRITEPILSPIRMMIRRVFAGHSYGPFAADSACAACHIEEYSVDDHFVILYIQGVTAV